MGKDGNQSPESEPRPGRRKKTITRTGHEILQDDIQREVDEDAAEELRIKDVYSRPPRRRPPIGSVPMAELMRDYGIPLPPDAPQSPPDDAPPPPTSEG